MSPDGWKALLAAARGAHQHRFDNEHDWRRLFILGCVLLAFSLLSFVDILSKNALLAKEPGAAFLCSGLAIVIMIMKISRADIYFDWVLNGLTFVGIGFAIAVDAAAFHLLPPIFICALLAASGGIRIWIGLTTPILEPSAWFSCSGGIALVAAALSLLVWLLRAPITQQSICAADLLLYAVSIVGSSIALRTAHRQQR